MQTIRSIISEAREAGIDPGVVVVTPLHLAVDVAEAMHAAELVGGEVPDIIENPIQSVTVEDIPVLPGINVYGRHIVLDKSIFDDIDQDTLDLTKDRM